MKYSCFYSCFSPTKKGLRRVRVLFDFQARNSKELTVQKGEEVAVRKNSCLLYCTYSYFRCVKKKKTFKKKSGSIVAHKNNNISWIDGRILGQTG